MRKLSCLAVVAAIGSIWSAGCVSPGQTVDVATLGRASADIKVLGVT